MAFANVREDLKCSICLDIYTDPVTLRCGHSFCRVCIDRVPDTEGGYGEYSCPDCRATFRKLPPLQKNIALCNVVDNFLATQRHHEEITTFPKLPPLQKNIALRNVVDNFLATQPHHKEITTFRKLPPLQKNIALRNVVDNFLATQPHHEEITGIFCTYCVESPVLDVKTAANNLFISADLKTATWTQIRLNRPSTAERFQDNKVMSKRGFTSGRHYWDVEISASGWWRAAICYPSMDRKGEQSCIGQNTKSWGLFGHNNNYSMRHNYKVIRLPHQISSNRFRICLDYEAGQLSFYELCDPIRHLHTFTAAFTEPLHALLAVDTGSIKILGSS